MQNLIKLSFLSIILIMTACQKEPIPPQDDNVTTDCDGDNCLDLVRAINQFGFGVMDKLDEDTPGENVIISPLSISTALTMTYNGADGQTKTQMQEALEFQNFDLNVLNSEYKGLFKYLTNLDDEISLDIANAIFHREGYAIEQDFLDTNADYFDSEIQALDFKDDASVGIINDWVKDNTNDKIPEILEVIPDETLMYLINAIYFKAGWRTPFDPEVTNDLPFRLADGSSITVPTMFADKMVPFLQHEKFSAIDLAYADSIYSMTLMLPNSGFDVADVVDELNVQNWEEWMASFQPLNMHIYLPKFKVEYEKSLRESLTALGMEDAFKAGVADFSKIAAGDLYITEVKHKTFLEVDEKGAEAAAVTSVGVGVTSLPPSFNVSKPFLLVIRENTKNTVLFSGKIMNPLEE